MQLLSIFLSSTCYDLKSLREHLRSEIAAWGHDPVLSDYPSFPVSPDLSTVENCKKVVRERADVFVLIVGGKRGSLDLKTERSIVNSEYREARAAGIDCIVFVDRQVWDLRPLFQKNPSADFSPTVDFSDVFRFIDEIESDTKWIVQFHRTDDILTILRQHLSIRFRDLLLRHRANRLLVPPEFATERSSIARIVQDKNSSWEYRLTSALLADRLERIDTKFNDIDSGCIVKRTKFLPAKETLNYIQDLFSDLTNIITACAKVLEHQLTPAFGPPGVAGDAIQIKRACDNLYSLFLALYEWEMDVRFVRPHEVFENLFSRMHGWTNELLQEFRRIPKEIDELLADVNLTGQHSIRLVINAPTGLASLVAEFERMSKDPNVLTTLASG